MEQAMTTAMWTGLVGVCVVVLVGIRLLNSLWFWPKKMEKLLRKQGLTGNPYRFLYGDTKDMMKLIMESRRQNLPVDSNQILSRALPLHNHIVAKHGKRSFMWSGPTPTVLVMDPEHVEEIMMKNADFRKPTPSPTLRLLLSGLAGYDGEKWAKHRKIMNPAFYMEKLKHMLPAMHLCCSELIIKWDELVAEKGSAEVDVSPHLQTLAANVIARTAFGSSYDKGKKIFDMQMELAGLVFRNAQSLNFPGKRLLPTKLNRRIKEISREAKILIGGVINEREKAMKLGEAGENDLLNVLLEANRREIQEQGNNNKAGMSIDDVIDECKLMYFVGQETTAQLLVWTMIMLSIHQEWQDRAREEILEVFGKSKPEYGGMNRLKTLTMILNEVLRLYPPAIMMSRVNIKETKLGDMVLPAGTSCMIPILFIHHDRDIWGEDAGEFNPGRFSEGIAKASNKKASFIPFGWGPRICIGNNFATLETKMALAMILQHFSFELSPSYTHSPSFRVTLQPQNGAHLILRKI